jgi:hypothetical protein
MWSYSFKQSIIIRMCVMVAGLGVPIGLFEESNVSRVTFGVGPTNTWRVGETCPTNLLLPSTSEAFAVARPGQRFVAAAA